MSMLHEEDKSALFQVPFLLEVAGDVSACLPALAKAFTQLTQKQLPTDASERQDLCKAASAAISFLPNLPKGKELLELAFYASGIVAHVATMAIENADLYKEVRPWLLEMGPAIVQAWSHSDGLLYESLDNNRHVFVLASILIPKEKALRDGLIELVVCCVCSSTSDFWQGRTFDAYVRGTVAALVHGQVERDGKLQGLLVWMLWQCHRDATELLLDRVLLFLHVWIEVSGKEHTLRERDMWQPALAYFFRLASSSIESRVQVMRHTSNTSLTPAACIVAALLPQQVRSTNKSSVLPLRDWLFADVLHAHKLQALVGGTDEEGDTPEDWLQNVLRGSVVAISLSNGQSGSASAWEAMASTLAAFLCKGLLPVRGLGWSTLRLQRFLASGVFRMSALAQRGVVNCLHHLPATSRRARIIWKLEGLAYEWSERWSQRSAGAAQTFFAKHFSLLIGSILRDGLEYLDSQDAACFIRVLASVDCLAPADSQSLEYVAMCKSTVECLAEDVPAVTDLIQHLKTLHRKCEERQARQADIARLYFFFGVLDCPALFKTKNFIPELWPVLLKCVGCLSNADWKEVALRAHALAAVCFRETHISEHAQEVRDYILASISFQPSDACPRFTKAFCFAVEALAHSAVAEGEVAAESVLLWLLRYLGERVVEHLQQDRIESAETLFNAFCHAARHAVVLGDPFRSDARLPELLQNSRRIREMWLQNIVDNFPEVFRAHLVARHLAQFPDTSACGDGSGEQVDLTDGLGNVRQHSVNLLQRLGGWFTRSAL